MLKARWQWQMFYLATKRNVLYRWPLGERSIIWKTANLEQRAHYPLKPSLGNHRHFGQFSFWQTSMFLMKPDTDRVFCCLLPSLGSIHKNGIYGTTSTLFHSIFENYLWHFIVFYLHTPLLAVDDLFVCLLFFSFVNYAKHCQYFPGVQHYLFFPRMH